MIPDDLLIALIISGIGLSIATLRAEYISRRARNTKERKKAIVQRELHANRLRPKAIDVPVAALRIHQHFSAMNQGTARIQRRANRIFERARQGDALTQGCLYDLEKTSSESTEILFLSDTRRNHVNR